MIMTIKSMQKRLIAKTEEVESFFFGIGFPWDIHPYPREKVIECDMLIREKEKLYVQLKGILARQPGPEIAEQLAWYKYDKKRSH